jgi:superfamily II DNA or RNA helicase
MSATPFKYGETDKVQKYMVKGFFGPELLIEAAKEDGGRLTTKGLQKRGRLSKSHCTFFPVREPNLEYELYQDAVTFGIAENFDFHHMVKKLALSQKGRTLILVERIAHGDALNNLIPGSLWVRGQDNDTTRKEVVRQLQVNENCIAIATQGIFNTGINVFIHSLINAAGGQAEHQIIQRMGRGLRTAKDKTMLQYYDFIFYNNEYLLKHSKKRIRTLKQQGHEIEFKDFDL